VSVCACMCECMCECDRDREASIMRKPWPTNGCCAKGWGLEDVKERRYLTFWRRNYFFKF